MAIDRKFTEISIWSERDRMHVCLSREDGSTIVEWWDGAVGEAVTDGFLSPRDWHGTAFAYASENGLLKPGADPVTIRPAAMGWVAENPGMGVYCGWRKGGIPLWSSEADAAEVARGAYVFDSEQDARDLFNTDGVEGGNFVQVEIEPIEGARGRTTFASCENDGLDLALPSPFPAH